MKNNNPEIVTMPRALYDKLIADINTSDGSEFPVPAADVKPR